MAITALYAPAAPFIARTAIAHTGAAAATTFSASVDSYAASTPSNLGILTPAQALAMKAKAKPAGPAPGTNTGGLGPQDPVVPAATAHARKVAHDRVDWKNPENSLHQLTQFDGKAEVGGTDPDRCGAAVVVAAGMLNGPEAFTAGLERIMDRASDVMERYQSLRGNQPAFAQEAMKHVGKGFDTLSKYTQMDPKKLTNADMSKIQEAVYSIAHADQLIAMDGQSLDPQAANDPYLTTNAVGEYFKLMTGAEAPQQSGKSVQPYRVQDANGRGHFVLGDDQGQVTYNPWPEADGKAFVGGGQAGPKVVGGTATPGNVQGKKVTDWPHTLPSRTLSGE